MTGRSRQRVLVWLALVMTAELAGIGLVLWHRAAHAPHPYDGWVVSLAVVPVGAPIAALLRLRQPANRVGNLLSLSSTVAVIQLCSGAVASLSSMVAVPRVVVVAAAWICASAQLGTIITLVVPLLYLPDGRLLSPRWRVVLALLLAGGGFTSLGNVTSPALGGAVYLADNPLVWPKPVFSALDWVGGLLLIAGLAGVVAAVVVRYRHAGVETRAAMKWVLLGGSAAIGLPVIGVPIGSALVSKAGWVSNLLWLVATSAIPVSIALAVLRYRLYDLDRIVSRTVSYVVVTALGVGTYVGLVLLADAVLPTRSSIGVAAATLAVAALVRPVYRRVQHAVDRRFNRARYDAENLVDAFARRLRDEVDLESVRRSMVSTVQRAVEPSLVSVWFRGQPT